MKIMIYICGALVLSTADAFLPALLRKRMTCRCGHRSQGMRRGNLSLVGNKGMSGGKVQDRQFISILSGDGTEQKLPMSSASRFPLWVIDKDYAGRRKVDEVPGASNEGWVDPRSYGELWIPQGSLFPTMKLCLGILVKDGQPRYAMPMVDLVVNKGGRKWRNRGLKSVPSAHCWEPVIRAASGALSIAAYTDQRVEDSKTDSMWESLVENLSVSEAFIDLVDVLADPPAGLEVGNGFHFLVAELGAAGSLPVPPYGSRVRVFLSDLAEPATLLELPDVTGVAELSFDVVAVASGRDSEFLPEVYKGLFAPDVGESSSEQSVE